MNKVVLMGRLTRDVELKTTPNGVSMARFTVAINSRFAEKADFINCVAWGRTAEVIEKYFKKGNMLSLEGRLASGSYEDKDGKMQYVTEVVAEMVYFCGDGGKK